MIFQEEERLLELGEGSLKLNITSPRIFPSIVYLGF